MVYSGHELESLRAYQLLFFPIDTGSARVACIPRDGEAPSAGDTCYSVGWGEQNPPYWAGRRRRNGYFSPFVSFRWPFGGYAASGYGGGYRGERPTGLRELKVTIDTLQRCFYRDEDNENDNQICAGSRNAVSSKPEFEP